MKILFKFASRSRPGKFFNVIRNIEALTKNKDYLILATLDEDDLTMNNSSVMKMMDYRPNLKYIFGTSKSKVDAINRDLPGNFDWDILVNMSDDMLFTVKDFDQDIINAFKNFFPDLDGMVHFPDGNTNCNGLITMSIMGRKYFDRFGYIYHPDYKSLWCDNEATDVSKMLGKYKYMGDNAVILNHNHPAHKKGFVADDLLKKTDSFYELDKKVYARRKANNFNISTFGPYI